MNFKSLIALSAVMGLALTVSAKDVDTSKLPPASDQKDLTFAKDAKPIFERSCVKCHGAEKPKAKLRLDSVEATLKGGENGKVVHAGESAKSVLIHNVAHIGDEDGW